MKSLSNISISHASRNSDSNSDSGSGSGSDSNSDSAVTHTDILSRTTHSLTEQSTHEQHRILGSKTSPSDGRDILSLFIGSVKTAQASSRALRTALYNQVRTFYIILYLHLLGD